MLLLSVSFILNNNPNDLTCSTCWMAARPFNAILCGFLYLVYCVSSSLLKNMGKFSVFDFLDQGLFFSTDSS